MVKFMATLLLSDKIYIIMKLIRIVIDLTNNCQN